ncbi:MAG: hypothetical protein JSR83_09190 [Proteobacteria bacterium]|nr:hypothetical protein [Pseudomonadota bacterium]
MIAFTCKPLSANPLIEPLVFEWDEHAGTVTGLSAELIRQAAADPGVPVHPLPAWHAFSAEPLKNRADLAAIVGYLHQLPAELATAYPAPLDELVTVEVLDADGKVVESSDVVY